MLDQFQARYSTGSLISELLQIHQGKFVVRVSAQVEGVTRATGMAADETLEVAEDRARSRALMVLGIEPIIATQASFPLQLTANELPSKSTTPLPLKGLMPQHQSPPSDSTTGLNDSNYASARSQQALFAESLTAPTDSLELSNERLPLTKSTHLVEEDFGQTAMPVEDPQATPLRTLTQDFGSQPTIDSAQEELPLNDVAFTSSSRPSHQEIPELEQSVPEPEDLSDLIAQTNFELERLGWSPEAGRDHLMSNYGKRSRQLLTRKELLGFLKYLKSQPTPRKRLRSEL